HLGEREILDLIYKEASGLMDTDNMYIAFYDEYTDIVRFGLAYVNGKKINVEIESGWQPRKAGQGKTEEIIRTKKPIFHATKAEAKKWYARPGRKDYLSIPLPSWIGVPMVIGDKAIGVIATYHPEREYVYSGDDLDILQSMANQAAIALESARSFENVQKRIEDQETINTIAQAISAKVGTNDLLQTIVSEIRKHLNCTHCAIFLPEKIGDNVALVSNYTHGEFAERIKSRRFKRGEGVAGWVFEHGETAIVPDTLQDERYVPVRLGGYQSRSLMVVPVKMNGKTVGVISADHKEINKFDEDNRRLVETLAEHVSIALEKGRAYEEIAKLYKEARGEVVAAKQLATLGTAIAALQHRINNTLNIIIPNITRLRSRIDVNDPTIREILDIIERNTRYTSDILMRIQTPLQEVETSDINVNSILSEVSEAAKKEWDKKAPRAKVKIKLDLDDSLPLIQLPVGQISEIVRNLIDNACRAMKKGGKLIIMSKMEKNSIQIRLKDTAKGGIPPAIQERLFQKPVPSKEPGQGAGLGLWLSRLMLQGIGGDVTIEETGSTGTTMLLQIPVTESREEATL
ncbi:MAG: GAF domain-containing protein, partial [Chloroflexi bacterium]